MKKLVTISLMLFFCGTVFSQIYTPLNPTAFGQNVNRVKPFLAQHLPEKNSNQLNTNDSTAQIFYNSLDSCIWYYTKYTGYKKLLSFGSIPTGNPLKWYAENSSAPPVAPVATGTHSIAIGSNAQALGSFSFVFGQNAGAYATNASLSNFIGSIAGYSATRASSSNFIGYYSGYLATDANGSNFIGIGAGSEAINARFSNFIGPNTGYQASKASYSNLFGYSVGKAFDGNNIGSNNIIIGTNISLPNLSKNSLNLGGILFGTGAHSDSLGLNPNITPSELGKIGIGIVNPDSTLHVVGGLKLDLPSKGADKVLTSDANGAATWRTLAGGSNVGDSLVRLFDSNSVSIKFRDTSEFGGTIATKANIFTYKDWGLDYALDNIYNKNTNNVGIGTSLPTEKLHISGSVRIVDGSQGQDKVLTSDANGKASWRTIAKDTTFITAASQDVLEIANTSGKDSLGFKKKAPTSVMIAASDSNMTARLLLTTDVPFAVNTSLAQTIQGVKTFRSSVDTVALSTERLTTGTGANWSGSNYTTGYTHTPGVTTALTSSFLPTAGQKYVISVTLTGTVGTVIFTLGGYTSATISFGATTNVTPTVGTTAAFVVTPSSTFDGTVTATIRQITSPDPATQIWANSNGVSNIEIRTSLVTSNQFIGVDAGRYNTTGLNNTANGNLTLTQNTSGNSNTAVGYNVLNANTTGTSNTGLGSTALLINSTGSGNTAVGTSAAYNTTGSSNTAIGNLSLFGNTTGNTNTAIGNQAGRYIANGTTLNTNSTNSVFIGSSSFPLADAQSNQIVIGHQAIGIGSNTVTLGNDAIVTTALKGSVGIGTTSPNASALVDMTSITKGLLIPRLTTTEMNAIATPATGLSLWNSTFNCPMYNTPDWGWVSDNSDWKTANMFDYNNELTANTLSDGILNSFLSGAGGGVNSGANPTVNEPGVYTLSCAATGSVGSLITNTLGNTILLGGGRLLLEEKVRVPVLSTFDERFTHQFGLSNNVGNPAGAGSRGVLFLYDSAGVTTGSAATPNWQVLTYNSSVRTYTTTAIPVVANQFYKLQIVINAANTSIQYYIDGTLVATHTTNIPSASVGFILGIYKATGSTGRGVEVGYIKIKQKFTTAR